MNTKHTRGQWQTDGHTITAFYSPHKDGIAEVLDDRLFTPEVQYEAMANARLIAAAPDLLESLQQTVESLEYWFKRYGDPEGANSQMMKNALAAIERATK